MMMGTVKAGERKWRVVGVYVNGDMEKNWDRIREWGEGGGEGIGVIVGGDFNARTGDKGGRVGGEEEEEEPKRKSKDKKVNREGRKTARGNWGDRMGNIKWEHEGERRGGVYLYRWKRRVGNRLCDNGGRGKRRNRMHEGGRQSGVGSPPDSAGDERGRRRKGRKGREREGKKKR